MHNTADVIAERARELVALHVDEHRADLARLVDAELDRLLRELVAERMAQLETRSRNGKGDPTKTT